MPEHTPRWYMANRDDPRHPHDYAAPSATSITIVDCGDPKCDAAHVLLMDEEKDLALAQATVNFDMALSIMRIILKKRGVSIDD